MIVALIIGAVYVAAVALVLSLSRGSNPDVPTPRPPRPAGHVVLAERARMRRCPRRPTSVG